MVRRKESETEGRMADTPSPSSGSPALLIPIQISPRPREEEDANESFQANYLNFYHIISQIQIQIQIQILIQISPRPRGEEDANDSFQLPLNVALQRQRRQHKLKLAGLSLLLALLVAALFAYVYFVHGQLFNGPQKLGGGGILLLGGGILATATFGVAAYLTCWFVLFLSSFLVSFSLH